MFCPGWAERQVAVAALCGAAVIAACTHTHPPLIPAPLSLPPPPPTGRTLAEEAGRAFGSTLPEDARLIRSPPWAELQAVWGDYDPPLLEEGVVRTSFLDPRTLLLAGGRGQVWLWDPIDHTIRGHIDGCAGEGGADAELLVTSAEGLAAVGFRSGHFCVIDLATRSVTAHVQASDTPHGCGSLSLAARIASGVLVTYWFTSSSWAPTPIGRDVGCPASGGELRSWDARTGAKLSDINVGAAYKAELSPDGERLVMVPFTSFHGNVISDDVRAVSRTGQVLWTKKSPLRGGLNLVFATNDVLLGTEGERLFSLRASDGALLGFFEDESPPRLFPQFSDYYDRRDIAITADGRYAHTAFHARHVIWDVGQRREIANPTPEYAASAVGNLVSSPDGSVFATRVGAIIGARGLEVVDTPAGPIQYLAISADARRVVAGRRFRMLPGLDLWDSADRSLRHWPPLGEAGWGIEAWSVTVSDDAERVALRRSTTVEVRDWSTGKPLWSVPVAMFCEAALSPDGHAVAMFVWENGDTAARTTLCDAGTGAVLWQDQGERPRTENIRFGREGRTVVFLDAEQRLVELDAHDGSVLRRTHAEAGTWTLAGDSRALIVGDRGKSVVAFDLDAGKPLWRTNEGREPNNSSIRLAVSPDGRTFFQIDDNSVRRRLTATGAEAGAAIDLGPSADAPRQLALSSDGRTLVVGTRRGVLLRFRVEP
jgi:hypothetical protein